MYSIVNRISITTRILVVVTLSLVVLASTLLVVVNDRVSATDYAQSQDQVIHATNVLRYLVAHKGAPAIVGGRLVFGRWVANGNFSIVDDVKQLTDATATLFQRLPDGSLIRVATNIRKPDGQRAVGTTLKGPAAAAFAQGQNYVGVNPILGQPYLTEYDIVRDARGQPVGMIYAGIPLTVQQQVTGGIVTSVLLTALAVLALTLGILFVILRRIGRAIHQVARAAQGLARGELDQRVDVRSADALGQMADAVRATIAYQSRVAQVTTAIAGGDLDRQIPLASEGDVLGRAFNSMVGDLRTHTALVQTEARTREEAARLERSVTQLIEELAPAAEGDLTVRPHLSADAGDIAVVADFTGVLIGSFADVARLVRDASSQVQVDSDRLTARIERLTQAVAKRTAQVNETAAVAGGIADSAGEVLLSVEQVKGATHEAVASVEQGNRAVAQTLERMDAMRAVMIGATQQIKRLSDSSLAVSGTVGLVLQFADDLNLLANNAQLEASRQGAGAGVFTAVAEQTGRLAGDAQKALTQIRGVVSTNRQETAEVGRQMEQMAAEMVEGARAVEEARAAFSAITRTVRELDGFVARVDGVARVQVEVANTVGAAMGQIAGFFDQTATDVRLSETDASSLRRTIDDLRVSIVTLKVEADDTAVARAA